MDAFRPPATTRRALLAAAAAATAAPWVARAQESYPSRPIEFVISFPPGGGADAFGRIIARGLQDAVGQPVVPVNKPGAGSVIGTNYVRNARPDGHTLLFATTAFLIASVVRDNAGYDAVNDFAPIGLLARATYVLVVNPRLGFRNVGDLIAHARAYPGQLKFGSPGIGVSGQLAGDLLRSLAGISFLDVRYRGSSEAILAVMSGTVDFCFESPVAIMGTVQSGRIAVIGSASETPDPMFPDVPTIASTLPGYSMWPWFGLVSHVRTPEPAMRVLRTALEGMSRDEALKRRLVDAGLEPFYMPADEFTRFLGTDRTRWSSVATKED